MPVRFKNPVWWDLPTKRLQKRYQGEEGANIFYVGQGIFVSYTGEKAFTFKGVQKYMYNFKCVEEGTNTNIFQINTVVSPNPHCFRSPHQNNLDANMYTYFTRCIICMFVYANMCDCALGQSQLNFAKSIMALNVLANSNPQPTIVEETRSKALFIATYNFREQDRVLREIDNVVKNAERMWPTLLEGASDGRYCITLGNLYSASNYTIGDICDTILAETLTAAYLPHIPKKQLAFSALQNPDIVLSDKFVEWCKERHSKGDKLYELQIEMCHWALAETEKLTPTKATAEEKAASMKAIQTQIVLLNSTKKPAVMRSIVTELRYPFSK